MKASPNRAVPRDTTRNSVYFDAFIQKQINQTVRQVIFKYKKKILFLKQKIIDLTAQMDENLNEPKTLETPTLTLTETPITESPNIYDTQENTEIYLNDNDNSIDHCSETDTDHEHDPITDSENNELWETDLNDPVNATESDTEKSDDTVEPAKTVNPEAVKLDNTINPADNLKRYNAVNSEETVKLDDTLNPSDPVNPENSSTPDRSVNNTVKPADAENPAKATNPINAVNPNNIEENEKTKQENDRIRRADHQAQIIKLLSITTDLRTPRKPRCKPRHKLTKRNKRRKNWGRQER